MTPLKRRPSKYPYAESVEKMLVHVRYLRAPILDYVQPKTTRLFNHSNSNCANENISVANYHPTTTQPNNTRFFKDSNSDCVRKNISVPNYRPTTLDTIQHKPTRLLKTFKHRLLERTYFCTYFPPDKLCHYST